MAGKVRTVKAPSLKTNIVDDVKEQIVSEMRQELKDMRGEVFEHDQYILNRVEKIENKEWERESKKLSVSDWCMVACYAAIFVVAVLVAIRTLKKTSAYGHS